MKARTKGITLGMSLSLCASFSFAQDAGTVLKEVISKTQTVVSGNNSKVNYTNTDAVTALKEVLQTGTKNASFKLAVVNGYLTNSLVKILLPQEVSKVEKTLRSLGFGSIADKTILYMNRAAEDAASKAAPIFLNAIKNITIQDGIAIVQGGNDAATNFLKSKTSAELTAAFKPVIEKSLNQYQAATYWNQIFTTYNKLPMAKTTVPPDLTTYVTEKALNGLFITIAQEENKIRTDPSTRVSTILLKVFGNK